VIAAIVLPALWGATRLSTISSDDESAEGRVDAWYEGFQMLRESPLFGVSMGGFVDHNDLTAHNSIVLAMAELGLVGYTFWFLFFVHSASLGTRAAHLDALDVRSGNRDAARAVVVAGIAVFVAAMFLSRSYNPLLFMVCGLSAGRYAAGLGEPINPLVPGVVPIGKMVMWAWLSIPIMYLVTIILLKA
jgi:O-antigen ligase